MTNRRLELLGDELEFLRTHVVHLQEQLHREVKLNAKAAKTRGATTIASLAQKLNQVPVAVGYDRYELRLLQRICSEVKTRLTAFVIPNYEARLGRENRPEIVEKYKKQLENLKKTCENTINPLLNKIEGKL